MNSEIIIIATFDYPHEMLVLRSLLESQGVECFTKDENTINTDPLVTFAIGGVKLGVFKETLRQALIILEEYKLRQQGRSTDGIDGELLELEFFANKKNEDVEFSKAHLVNTLIVITILVVLTLLVAYYTV